MPRLDRWVVTSSGENSLHSTIQEFARSDGNLFPPAKIIFPPAKIIFPPAKIIFPPVKIIFTPAFWQVRKSFLEWKKFPKKNLN